MAQTGCLHAVPDRIKKLCSHWKILPGKYWAIKRFADTGHSVRYGASPGLLPCGFSEDVYPCFSFMIRIYKDRKMLTEFARIIDIACIRIP
jgi:hypothetical protein